MKKKRRCEAPEKPGLYTRNQAARRGTTDQWQRKVTFVKRITSLVPPTTEEVHCRASRE